MVKLIRDRVSLIVTALVVVGCFVLGASGLVPIPTVEIAWPIKSDKPHYVPAYTTITGRELMLVYIGSSTCGFSNAEPLPRIIEDIKLGLQRRADELGIQFSATGVFH